MMGSTNLPGSEFPDAGYAQREAIGNVTREWWVTQLFTGWKTGHADFANGSIPTETSCEPCPLGWKVFQGSCYFFSLDKLTWTQANDSCVQKQAHLVVINSRTEQVEKGKTRILAGWGRYYKRIWGFIFLSLLGSSTALLVCSSRPASSCLYPTSLQWHARNGLSALWSCLQALIH